MTQENIAAVLDAVDPAASVRLFCELVAIDNESYDERAMADAVTARLQAMGLSVYEDDAAAKIGGNAGNLYAALAGTGTLRDAEPLAFCAHLDSVSPATGKRATCYPDGTIRGNGAAVLGADDLTAVSAMLETVRILQQSRVPHRPIELLFTVCEEPYTVGSRAIDWNRMPLRAKSVIVPDLAGRMGTAAFAAPTILAVTITVQGRAAHAGFEPENGIHAIAVAAHALSRLQLGHVDADTTVGIGTITGGTVSNAVPACCVLTGEIRGYRDERVREEWQRLQTVFQEEAAAVGATVHLQAERRTVAYEMPEHAAPIRYFRRACRIVGLPCRLTRTFGGSDANTFAAVGREVLVIASGMENIHSPGEHTDSASLAQLCRLLLAMAFCSDQDDEDSDEDK